MILWLASYPKSGNTWVRTFISTYYFGNNNKFEFSLLKNIKQFPHEKFFSRKLNNINDAIEKWVEAQENIIKANNITFLKTHSAFAKINNFPFTTNKQTIGAIYIIRDPRNVVTSISNHFQMDFENTINFMINKRKFLINKMKPDNYGNFTFLNSWSEHYNSWIRNNQFKTLLIKYEDLQKNSIKTFERIVLFINEISNKDEKIDKNKIEKIVDSISFENLKKREQLQGFPEAVYNDSNKKINFFYLGKKNNWKKIFTKEQIEILNKTFYKDLKYLNY